MKRVIGAVLAVACAAAFASCAREDEFQDVTAYVTRPTTAEVTLPPPTEVETVAHKVEKITSPKETEAEETETKKKKKEKTTEETITEPPTQGKVKPGRTINVTLPPVGSFSDADLEFNYKKILIELGDDMSELKETLGEENSLTELSKSRKEYEYDDFIISTYSDEDIEMVTAIEVTNEDIATSKGAKPGMYASRLKRLYGDPSSVKKNMYIYGDAEGMLEFSYEDNIVTSYAYRMEI